SSIRQVDFVEKLELSGISVRSQSLVCLADVDNDGCCELLLASSKQLATSSEAFSEAKLRDETYLCRVLVYKGESTTPAMETEPVGSVSCLAVGDLLNDGGRNLLLVCCAEGDAHLIEVSRDPSGGEKLSPALRAGYRLAPNGRHLLIADIDADGRNELVVATSDRLVFSYRASQSELTPLQRWELVSQIGSLSLHEENPAVPAGPRHVLVSQQGGAYVTLCVGEPCPLTASKVIYHSVTPITSDRRHFPTTEIVCGVRRSRVPSASAPPYMAMCTLDGSLLLLDGVSDKQIWSLQVTHQLFGLAKLDLTNDAAEEVILCSWDGMSYIVNHHKEVVKFQFPEPCLFFAAGCYGFNGRDLPVLLYGTFDCRLVMYTGICLEAIPAYPLLGASDDVDEGLARLADRTGLSRAALVRMLLYDRDAVDRLMESL
ncbi:hypothetical protein BOX15_Mlig019000g4, partial [Macrostomum lignano]